MADDAAAPEGELSEDADKAVAAPESSPDEVTESPAETESPDDITEAPDEATETPEDGTEAAVPAKPRKSISLVALVSIIGLVAVLILAGVGGWLGWRMHQSQQAEQQRALYLQVGKQGALNLTTIDFEHADADVQRILDSATDTFYDDFSKRSQPFVDVVKQAKSKSTGEVTAAGLESEDADGAQVLVAVTVKTSNAGAPEQAPRAWRMRISVKKVGDQAKVSNVEFVP